MHKKRETFAINLRRPLALPCCFFNAQYDKNSNNNNNICLAKPNLPMASAAKTCSKQFCGFYDCTMKLY